MPEVFIYTVVVGPSSIDAQQHVNNVQYVQWMQDVAVAAAEALDHGATLMRSLNAAWVVRSHHVEYGRPAVLGDRLDVTTWLTDVTAAACVRHYEFRRNGTADVTVRGRTEWVFVDAATGRPRRLPAEVRSRIGG